MRVHLAPPSCVTKTPLPGPPLNIAQVCITTSHVPANSVFGLCGIHREAGAAGVRIDEERRASQVFPPSVVLKTPRSCCGPVSAAGGADVDDIRIGRVDRRCGRCDRSPAAHVRPGLAGVGGFVNAVAHHVAIADRPGFSGPRPYRSGIGRCDGERADRCDGLLVEYGAQRFPPSVDFQTPPEAAPA